MDPESFLEMANQVTKLKMFPYFEIAHCVITCLYMREDLAAGSLPSPPPPLSQHPCPASAASLSPPASQTRSVAVLSLLSHSPRPVSCLRSCRRRVVAEAAGHASVEP